MTNPSTIPPVSTPASDPARAPRLDPGLADARYAMAEIINCIELGVESEQLEAAFRELGRGCLMLAAGYRDGRNCTGCSVRINAWSMLPLVGYQLDGDEAIELRTCTHCNTTLAARVPEHELADVRLAAFEHWLRSGEARGRSVELKVLDGRLCIDVKHRHGNERSLRGVESLAFGLRTLAGGGR